MDVALTTSPDVIVRAIHAGSESDLWDSDLVLAGSGLDLGRSDVCSSSATGAESSILMIANNSFTDNLSVAITIKTLGRFSAASTGDGGRGNERGSILANVSGTCR